MKITGLVVSALLLAGVECFAQTPNESPAKKLIDGKLICSPYSANPKEQPAFQLPLQISFSGGLLTAERKLTEHPGKEAFYGLIGSLSQDVMMIGEGRRDSGSAVWVYELHGKFNPNGTTILKGTLKSTIGAIGGRTCAIEFG
jgi:hypothetical protein